jgi:uncharacterized protein YxjI
MNVFIGSGEVTKVNLLNGGKILKFILATQHIDAKQKQVVENVPCIIFNPDKETQNLLSENQVVELQGRVRTFSFEVAGEKNYKTEVLVNQRSLKILD